MFLLDTDHLGIVQQRSAPEHARLLACSPSSREVLTVKFAVTIERDEDGVWVVECPSIPGCASQGATKNEALENVKDAIAACLTVRSQRGMPLTIEPQHD